MIIPKRICLGLLASLSLEAWAMGVAASPEVFITEVMTSNRTTVRDEDGDASDWLEVFNAGSAPIDLGAFWLSDDPEVPQKWAFPKRQLQPGDFLVVFASGKDRTEGENLHANFRLGAKGEFVSLVKGGASQGAVTHQVPKLATDQSFGLLFKDGEVQAGSVGTLRKATPGAVNGTEWALPRTKDTKFSVDRGFYGEAFQVAITSATPGVEIRYTTDGTLPSRDHGERYEGPIDVKTTTILRAVAFAEGHEPSDVDTQTYLFARDVVRQPKLPEGWPRTRPGYSGRRRGFFNFGGGMGGSVPLDYAMAAPESIGATESEVVEALKAIPSFSIVTDQAHLLDTEKGIYAHPQNRGREWERPISIELIDPTGREEGFQWDAGLRIRGGHSRSPYCAKHAFRVYFRKDYGDGKLRYPLFGSEGIDEFDDFDLRTSQNYSFHYSDDGSQMTMIREVFARDTQRALGQPYARSRYYHLYLNGLYWGLYQSQEHTEASYAAHYFGGEEEDYDVMKARVQGFGMGATDGGTEAWYHLYEKANAIAAETDEAARLRLYHELRGRDAEGRPDPDKVVYLDESNLIDYMLTIFYVGSFDAPISRFMGNRGANNWFGLIKREGRMGFQFFCHDTEHSLGSDWDETIDRVGPFSAGQDARSSNPQWIHQQLMAVEDYRRAFQERAEWALLDDDGPLTEKAAIARINRRAAMVSEAIMAECARWGDYKDRPGYQKSHWDESVERLRGVARVRSEILPEQLRAAQRFSSGEAFGMLEPAPLFNPIPVPAMSWKDDARKSGFFRLGEGDEVTYTVDGTDPRVSKTAKKAAASTKVEKKLLRPGGMIRAHVPSDESLGRKWTALDFDDSGWRAGIGGAGYDARNDYRPLLGIDFTEEMMGRLPTVLTRSLFEWDGAEMERLILRLKFEDGFVAYLNGREVASMNVSRDRRLITLARGQHPDTRAMQWVDFDISEHISQLTEGENVLAIQALNDRVESSDLLIYPQLVAQSELPGTEIVVSDTVREIQARAEVDGRWGPLRVVPVIAQAANDDTVAAEEGKVVISEIMYHPGEPSQAEQDDGFDDPDDFEFLELMNVSENTVDLGGASFTQGITFEFPPSTLLAPGARAVLIKDRGAFEKRYGSEARVIGLYDGGLKNSGERLTLESADEEEIFSVSFKDDSPWPQSPDGMGFSLALKDPKSLPSPNQSGSWAASSKVGGSPGAGEVATAGGVVINEILTHTDLPDVDAIELHNPTDAEIDVSGWFLTDDRDEPSKYTIVSGSVIPAGGYLVVKGDTDDLPENNDSLPADRFARSFSLSSHGEEIFLFAADAEGNRTGYSHGFEFSAGENGVSFGRHFSSAGKEQFPPQVRVTLGQANAGPRRPLVVISEIMYHPSDDDPDEEGEFVEIWNWSQQAVPLFDPLNPQNAWQLSGVGFTFPAGQTLMPNEVAVVSKLEPETFRRRYNVPDSVKVYGPIGEAKLSNSGERLRLLRPDLPDTDTGETIVPMLEVDSVRFNDRDPWPEDADGGGPALERDPKAPYTDDPSAWRASDQDNGTPGVAPKAE